MIPSKIYSYTIKKGMNNHDVWALQINLNELQGTQITEDGDFGDKTFAAVRSFQAKKGLTQDGIAGPATQRALALELVMPQEKRYSLPVGLMKGLIEGESGFIVGCVNWSVPGGVDCGWIQDRVYTNEYNSARFKKAFSGSISFDATASKIRNIKNGYDNSNSNEQAWKYAILYHNWPVAADRLAAGKSIYLDSRRDNQDADWVIAIGVKGVRTPVQWANFYIKSKTQYITSWPK